MATKTAVRNAKTTPRKTAAKRPAARRVQSQPSAVGRVLRENLHWLFLGVVAVGIGVLLYYGYVSVTASGVFAVKNVNISGTKNTDQATVEKTVRGLTAKSGVWQADLSEIQKEVEQISWVKSASVSRVLPDGLRVRVTEREPKAVVRLDSGARVWVDDDARVLGEAATGENLPLVMSGWNEFKDDAAATRKNQERVKLYLQLQREWQTAELLKTVKAVDLKDLQEIEIRAEQNGAELPPINVGGKDFTQRLKTALASLDSLGSLENVEKILNYDGHPVLRYKNATPTNENPAKTGARKRAGSRR